MTPLPPTPPAVALPPSDPTLRPTAKDIPPAGDRPMQGASAVPALTATRETARDDGVDATQDRVEPPPDPPPVKGLGIPPLNMQRVGDGDQVPTPPDPDPDPDSAGVATLGNTRDSLNPPDTPSIDRRA